MAQLSKKDQIAEAALGLFLEHGIKGTSVDMVVKTSGVSKPTVYNHFPDKATLLLHVIQCWVDNQPVPSFTETTTTALCHELTQHWLTSDNLRLYGLFMGEGFRAPEAKTLFKRQYDQLWRQALSEWGTQHKLDTAPLNAAVNEIIFNALL